MKLLKKIMLTFCTIFLSFIIFSAIDPKINDGILYHLDLSDPSTFNTSCYEVLNSKWRVDNDICFLETSNIHIPGSLNKDLLDIPVSINIKCSGNLESDDYVLLQYIDLLNNKLKTIDSIPGNIIPVINTTYSYLIKSISSGSYLKLRITFKTNAQREELTLQCTSAKDFCVGSPFISGTFQQYFWTHDPVIITSFTAIRNSKNVVDLMWETTSEFNNKFFSIERSTNGIDFSKIYTTLGQKYSNTRVTYNFTDTFDLKNNIFYRLKQTSSDNNSQYFDIVRISIPEFFNKEFCKINVDPNPCVGKCLITLDNCADSLNIPLQFNLIDALGNITYINFERNNINNTTYKFDEDYNLNPGIFILKSEDINKL